MTRNPSPYRAVVGLLLGGAAVLVASAAMAADASRVYRWTDRDGRVHYGDAPPSNAVELNPPRSASGGEPPVAAPKIDAAECERRRQQLDSYRKASTISETNSLGEKRELSASEQVKLIERADSLTKAACGEAAAAPASEK